MISKSTDELARIAAAGGGFRINKGLRSANDLIRIAAAAATGGARITIYDLGLLSTDDLIRIGAAGRGAVVFELE